MEEFLFFIVASIALYMLFVWLYAWTVSVVGGTWARVNAETFANDTVRIANERAELDKSLVPPYKNGALPVARQLIDSGHYVDAQFALLSQGIDAGKTFAPVPHSITYSPHLRILSDPNQGAIAETAAAMFQPPPSFTDLFQSGVINKNDFVLGYTQDGQPLKGDLGDVYSNLIIAKSGGGVRPHYNAFC